MSGGKEKKKTNSMLDQQYSQNQQDQNRYMGTVNEGLDGSRKRADDMYNVQFGGFKDFADGKGNFDPSKYGSSGGGGGGGGLDSRFGDVESSYRNFMGGGGVDTGKFNQFQGHLMDVARNGGIDADARGRILGDYKSMRDTANDSDVANRFRGNGVYDEFSKTGGLSDSDRQNIRQRATSVIPSMYGTMRDEANRASAVQGGYGPGRSAMFARMGRDQASAAQDAALNAELGITDKVNEGRMWGAQGASQSESALQGMRLGALGGAASGETNLWDSIARNRTGAANAGAGNETGMQGVIQQGKMFGTQGLEGMAESSAARGAAASNAAAADARWRAGFDREGQQYGLEGMQSLYGMAPGEVNMYLGAADQGRRTNSGVAGNIIDQRMQNNPQRDWLGTVAGIAGAAGGAMTGIGNLGFGRRRPAAGGGQ
jgi:hypothetical protein